MTRHTSFTNFCNDYTNIMLHKVIFQKVRFVIILSLPLLLTNCININFPPPAGPLKEQVLSGTGESKVLVVEISGMISSQDDTGLLPRPNLLAHVKEVLSAAQEDSSVKAVVVRINSPGGTVTASDILYHELRKFKEKRKIPLIMSIMDLGTSGGYYIAAAGDQIVAHPSTVTGSLGVIMLTVNASGLLEKIGVQATAVTSGPRKDMGSPFRAMTEEERAIFQNVIDSFYQRFLMVIQEGRGNLSAEQIRQLADGRIYSGEQAKVLGLVDEIGYVEDAIDLAKKRAGLKEAKIVTYKRPGQYRQNIYSTFLGKSEGWSGLAQLDLMTMVRGGTPQFMYLWLP